MRALFTIPHYVRLGGDDLRDRRYGALGDVAPRIEALAACLAALHQLFQPSRPIIDHCRCVATPVTAAAPCEIDVVVCTARGRHILGRLRVAHRYYEHVETDAAPELLGFTCHDVLRERLGQYDYYCYVEDDLVLHDPWLFAKLGWFSRQAGDDKLLQPNRFEAGLDHLVPKVYVDGDLAERVTAPFQDVRDSPSLTLEALGQRVVFERTLNPHAGCFFLNARQMEHWTRQPHFADRQSRFLGPLESAASLGIMRTFKVYKPAPACADFLEVQHYGTGYLAQLCPPGKEPS